jgi:(1->4)-alpha-D-glucan 1-alpha-D-glucosylmutase
LNVLSEIPDLWKSAVSSWRALNRRFKKDVAGRGAPDPNEEYLLYQTLVGAWPFDAAEEDAFLARVKSYLTKALREAKVHTSWLSPNEEYEGAVDRFVDTILDRRRPFLAAFRPFQARVAELGIYNSLAQLVIKIAAPGVPDFYQGSELWNLSLVDPDNRSPVDYDLRRRLIGNLPDRDATPDQIHELLTHRADGRIKLFVTRRSLRVRAAYQAVFKDGSYIPLGVDGECRDSIFAFARRHERDVVIACVPRMVTQVTGGVPRPPIGDDSWKNTTILLPTEIANTTFRDAFTGASVAVTTAGDRAELDLRTVLRAFPVALLVSADAGDQLR